MLRPSDLAVAVLMPFALALPGCGDDEVSTEDYARDLDEICADLQAETERIQRSRPADTTELTRQVDALRDRPGVRAAARKLQEIDDDSALERTDELAKDIGANRCVDG